MGLNEKQYDKIVEYLPRQRGNVSMSNLQLVNAVLHVAENGCKWRALPKSYGNWHTVYTRMNHWNKMVFCNVFLKGFNKKISFVSEWRRYAWTAPASRCILMDRGFEKNGKQSIGRSRGGLTTKIHMVTASDRSAVSFSLSPGNAADEPEGRTLLNFTAASKAHRQLIMDRAYESDETRALAIALGYIPVVPPKKNRRDPWEYDQKIYRQRNEVERFFLRIKRFRRIFTCYNKQDMVFAGFILFVMIIDFMMDYPHSKQKEKK